MLYKLCSAAQSDATHSDGTQSGIIQTGAARATQTYGAAQTYDAA